MPAPQTIIRLVETFRNNIESLKSGNYNETQVRREFIDPFFDALGWDVFNKNGYAEAYKDVIHEYSQKTTDTTKNPDYCFRIGGKRKFFVEAKKPSVNLKDDIHPAYQLRRYGWSAKLSLCILTDFEEFAVYDCRIVPKKNDKASTARIMFLTYEDYIDKWDELVGIFSKDAVLKGSFDKYAESNKKKRGTADVDEAFLKEMEEWRNLLAHNIALRNSNLSIRELNYAVQKTIDRLIFLRICEDRGIENYGQLMNLLNGTNVYERLKQIFTRADEKYNSGLFHFEKEKDRNGPPDEITPTLQIDDKTLKDIIKKLYYPESPYEFSVLPADILGHVYEQFLGRVIRLTPAHYAVVEDKPEVKKAGGVYYTPTYIVDYIVKNTVGKILEKRTPKQVTKISILDPACGSGSFLIGAYQYLLDWHLKFYTDNVERISDSLKKRQPPIYQIRNNEYRLTTAERKRILLNNIYGVDIDSQAVEVTKLSLLLKVLEGESEETLQNQFKMFRERALPNLTNNIKCGNSLIGPDFYDQMEMNFLDDEEKLKINIFDWKTEFPDIFKAGVPVHRSPKNEKELVRRSLIDEGGFDVVIGNPPYVKIQVLNQTQPEALKYFRSFYESGSSGNFDIYVLFTEKGSSLLNKNGLLGFIQPHKFFQAEFGEGLRNYITKNRLLFRILNFNAFQVFKEATTYTCLLFLKKSENKEVSVTEIKNKNIEESIRESENSDSSSMHENFQSKMPDLNQKWSFCSPQMIKIMNRLNENKLTLGDITKKIFVGLQTSADKIYVLDIIEEKGSSYICYSKSLETELELEKGILKPFLMGKDVKRYQKPIAKKVVIFPYVIKDGKADLMSQAHIKRNYPNAWNYLSINKESLGSRENSRMKGQNFYAYIYPKNLAEFDVRKIITPYFAEYPNMTVDKEGMLYHTTKVYSIILNDSIKEKDLFFLSILNSKLFHIFISNNSTVFRGGWIVYATEFLKPFPVKLIDFNNEKEKELYNVLIKNVKKILSNKEKFGKSRTPTEQTALQRQIDATDKQIDKLVYELYGLTEEEIKIVEGVK